MTEQSPSAADEEAGRAASEADVRRSEARSAFRGLIDKGLADCRAKSARMIEIIERKHR